MDFVPRLLLYALVSCSPSWTSYPQPVATTWLLERICRGLTDASVTPIVQVIFGEDARKKLADGINAVADAVKVKEVI